MNARAQPVRLCAPQQAQQGATLLEILIALLVLSVGLLGMAALQARAIKGNVSAGQKTQAVVYAQYMLDAMRVDRERAKGGDYNTGSARVCNPTAFGGTSLADNTRSQWLADMKSSIGRPDDTTTCARIACNADYECTVTVEWDDSRAGGLANQSIALSSRL